MRTHLPRHLVVAALTLVGATIAARLTAYQLGWAGPPWEPFSGDGSVRVLHSAFSRALPFPDAGLGLCGYLAELAAVVWVSTSRPRGGNAPTYTYAAIAFGLALASAGLVVLQLAVIHAFCTLCVGSALVSFVLVVPAAVELRERARLPRSLAPHRDAMPLAR